MTDQEVSAGSIELLNVGSDGRPVFDHVRARLGVRFVLPNGASVDVSFEGDRLRVNGSNSGPLAVHPIASNAFQVSCVTAYDHSRALEEAKA